MNPLFVLGVFTLGAGAGGFCILLQQRGVRSRFHKEIAVQLDKALFDPIRRGKEPAHSGSISTIPLVGHRRPTDVSNAIKVDAKRHVKANKGWWRNCAWLVRKTGGRNALGRVES
jgi:hypothetical protein